MKITGFTPIIVSPNAAELIQLFEDLGFEKAHVKTDIEGGQNINTDMKHPDGFRVDVASTVHLPKDLTAIRINVDNFEEAVQFLASHGFVNSRGEKITETSSSKDSFFISPSGFGITLSQHKKD